ncbi:MAG: hypothetical protein ABSA66_12940 [Roseiarcus sp.]
MQMAIRVGGLVASIFLTCYGLGRLDQPLRSMSGVFVEKAIASEMTVALADVCSWNDVPWKDLSDDERKTWQTLGWTQAMWDSDDPKVAAPSDFKAWSDLSDDERNAAQKLGYNERNWDSDTCKNR